MDDQQGNVIDGTARAHQWRLARSQERAASDEAEARFDAPKSIAGSLLVPADMLTMGSPVDDANGRKESGVTDLPASREVAVDGASRDGAARENPFLAPQAGREVPDRSRRRSTALLSRVGGRALAPGRYVAALWATDAAGRSPVKSLPFRIEPPQGR